MTARSGSSASRCRRLALDATPEEMAVRLRRLPGFAWLDTAGNSHCDGEGISVLAARPRRILTGNVRNFSPLRRAMQAHASGAAADLGLPAGGLIGWVAYDGDYVFGDYDRVLIHRHATGEWWEAGDLLSAAREEGDCAAWNRSLRLAPQVSCEDFCAQIRRAREYIAAGDIYQVNLSHPFAAAWPGEADPFALYLRLRDLSPAPYAAFMDLAGRQVLCSSPESFLKMSGRFIRTRPIKGTRPRCRDQAADQKSALDLLSSEKERAELLMITDLERSDLGRVCQFGSVSAPELLKLEPFAQVFHLVSTVQGMLREDCDHLCALQACFPGGSITGAPKKRAMEIIGELEPFPRGIYTGAIGMLGAGGESSFNIAIRTAVVQDGMVRFHAGAGIVADSDPLREWEETLHKASGFLAAAGGPDAPGLPRRD
jgi:aminodeoxychorismate synthase component I